MNRLKYTMAHCSMTCFSACMPQWQDSGSIISLLEAVWQSPSVQIKGAYRRSTYREWPQSISFNLRLRSVNDGRDWSVQDGGIVCHSVNSYTIHGRSAFWTFKFKTFLQYSNQNRYSTVITHCGNCHIAKDSVSHNF